MIYEPSEVLGFATEKLRTVGDAWNLESSKDSDDVASQERQGARKHEIVHGDNAFGALLSDFSTATAEITAVDKHASFADERETRLTASASPHAVGFSPGANGPRPRVRVASSKYWGKSWCPRKPGSPSGRSFSHRTRDRWPLQRPSGS